MIAPGPVLSLELIAWLREHRPDVARCLTLFSEWKVSTLQAAVGNLLRFHNIPYHASKQFDHAGFTSDGLIILPPPLEDVNPESLTQEQVMDSNTPIVPDPPPVSYPYEDDPCRKFILRCLNKRFPICRLMTVQNPYDAVPCRVFVCQGCGGAHEVLWFKCYLTSYAYTHFAVCPTTNKLLNIQLDLDYCCKNLEVEPEKQVAPVVAVQLADDLKALKTLITKVVSALPPDVAPSKILENTASEESKALAAVVNAAINLKCYLDTDGYADLIKLVHFRKAMRKTFHQWEEAT